MANLDAMRRRFALDEEAPVEGGMSPTTTEERLAQFAAVDAEEEANAASRGMSVDDLRFAKRQKQREQEYLDAYGMPMETKPFVQVPPSMRSPETKAENSEPFAAMAPMAERLMASRKQGLPTTSVDFASLQKTMSPGALASPIPFASAPVKADVPEAMKGAIAATTPTQPAPSAGTSSTVKPPPVGVEGGGGDDELGRLSMGQALVRALEGSGSVISGQNLRSGAADTLGERMKQIEALRAKRAQTVEERALEQEQYEGANIAALTSNIASFKDRPEVVAALENLRSGAKYTKPSDFLKAVYQAVMNPPTLAGKEATTERTGAQTAQAEERTTTEEEVRPGKVRKLRTAADLDEARIRALNAKSAADALALTKSRAAVADAGKAGTPSKDAIKYIRDDLKTAEKAITPTLENFKAIESVSPGFAFGRPDKQLETLEFVTASKLPRFAKQASDLRSAVEALIIDIRHGSFGASLTATEKASFESMLNTGLSGTVGQLSKAIDRVRRKAAATAQTHFNTSQQFYPTETQQVLSTSAVFGPATRKGGVYADVWTLPGVAAGETPAAGGDVVPPAGAVEKLKANPAMREAFDLKYGAGAAAKALGGE